MSRSSELCGCLSGEKNGFLKVRKCNFSSPHLTLPALKEKCLRNYEVLAKPLRAEFEEPQIEQIHKVLSEMPTIEVALGVRGPFEKDLEADRPMPQPLSRDFWLDIYADQEYTLNVDLNRLGMRPSKSIHCPNFPKGKDEGWFLSLGSQETGELLALKRVMYRSNKSSHQLCFVAPSKLGAFGQQKPSIFCSQRFLLLSRSCHLHSLPDIRWLHWPGPAIQSTVERRAAASWFRPHPGSV
jgi:Sec63 Brl domain